MVSMKLIAPIGAALLGSVTAAPASYLSGQAPVETATGGLPYASGGQVPVEAAATQIPYSSGGQSPMGTETAEVPAAPSSVAPSAAYPPAPSGSAPSSGGCNPGDLSSDGKEFSLKEIPSSKDLKWVPCYAGFSCARLTVPNDYSAPDNDAMASIPLILSKSQNASTSGQSQMMLLNPGGPGGSGIGFVLGAADKLHQLLPGFDLVSWDPRGVGFAIPSGNCVDDITEQAGMYSSGLVGNPGSTNESLYEMVALAKAQSMACEIALGGEKGAGAFMSTSTVAQDMISITDAYNTACGQPKGGLVNFAGYSYGTVLGQYFASMFPDRVGKIILDGVVDVDDYATGAFERDTITSDAAADKFFSSCFEAGPEKCPLYDQGGADVVKQNVMKFLGSLDKEPVAGVLQGPPQMPLVPSIVTTDIFKSLVFESLYQPQGLWTPLAAGIAEVLQGQPPRTLLMLSAVVVDKPVNVSGGSEAWDLPLAHGEWLTGVTCSDVYPANSKGTVDEILAYNQKANQQSFWAGNGMTNNKLTCVGWPFDGKAKFKGHFGGKTKNPILFIGNTLDPITPMVNAIDAAKKFEGAGFLKNDGPGHCSLSALSPCVSDAYAAYLSEGKLPAADFKGCTAPNAFEAAPPPHQSQAIAPNGSDKQKGTSQSPGSYVVGCARKARKHSGGPLHR